MIRILVTIGIATVVALIWLMFWGFPQYNVYVRRLSGEAELANAEYSRQVTVKEALAKRDSAALLAEAEVARAKGVAQANEIIGKSLQNNEAYLRYLWITDVTGNKSPTVIYVPTEANIPILEATRNK